MADKYDKTNTVVLADECDKIQFNYGGLMRQNAKRRQNLTITNTITKTKKLKAAVVTVFSPELVFNAQVSKFSATASVA